MTWRGAALLLAPLVLVLLGVYGSALLIVGLVVFVAAAVVVVIDGRRALGRDRLRVNRELDPILSVGRPNVVRLRIDVSGPAAEAVVRDEHPPQIPASIDVIRTTVPAHLEYTITPSARGVHQFGRTTIRVTGPWRLGQRQLGVGDAAPARVDPDLSAVQEYDALARRGQLAEIGVRHIRRPGEGTEFERIRDATPDDPLRAINWKATARTGRLMVSELIPERSQPVIIALDHGRLMGVGAGALTKLDHSINAALLLVNVALRFGDRAGLVSFDDHVTATLTPRAGRGQLRAFLDAVQPLRAGTTEADYDEAFGFLSSWQQRRALVAIFTDVLDPDQGAALLRQCARIRRRHLPLVITVRDPALDDAVRRRPADATAVYGRAVAGSLLDDRATTLRMLRLSGIDTLDADARSLSPRLVNRYLELKARGKL